MGKRREDRARARRQERAEGTESGTPGSCQVTVGQSLDRMLTVGVHVMILVWSNFDSLSHCLPNMYRLETINTLPFFSIPLPLFFLLARMQYHGMDCDTFCSME